MNTNEIRWQFDKRKTGIAKGIAILLMLIHHFFGFPKWIAQGNTYIGIPTGDATLIFYVAKTGKICVGIFLFLTGYGLYHAYSKSMGLKSSVNRIIKFLINYWVIILLFLGIRILLDIPMPNGKELFGNMFGFYTTISDKQNLMIRSIVGFAWYVRLFIAIQLLLPLLVRRVPNQIEAALIYAIIPFWLLYRTIDTVVVFDKISGIKYVLEFLRYIPITMVGYVFAKFNIFEKFKRKFIEKQLDSTMIYLLMCILILYWRYKKVNWDSLLLDVIYAPMFIYAVVNTVEKLQQKQLEKTLIFLGKHSLNLWFLHAIFFGATKQLQSIAYYPKVWIFIIIWVIMILLPISIGINCLLAIVSQLFNRGVRRNETN